jgi:hypothetical protein
LRARELLSAIRIGGIVLDPVDAWTFGDLALWVEVIAGKIAQPVVEI